MNLCVSTPAQIRAYQTYYDRNKDSIRIRKQFRYRRGKLEKCHNDLAIEMLGAHSTFLDALHTLI